MAAPEIYKARINQAQSRKGIIMTVDDLEDNMVYLYHLLYLGEESYEEDE